MDGLLVYVGLVSLLVILAYPFASFSIGYAWLRDAHWDATFARLGEEIFDAKHEHGGEPLPTWGRRLRSGMSAQGRAVAFSFVPDAGRVRAVAILTGGRTGPASIARDVRRVDGLLRRAVAHQIEEMDSLPYDRDLGKAWYTARSRKNTFVSLLSVRDFTSRGVKFTLTQVGIVSSGALFLGAFAGLGWWVLEALVLEPSSAPPADWTPVAGTVVTLLTVVGVAAVLASRLARALMALFPKPATWLARGTLAFVLFLALAFTVQLAFGFTHFDVDVWMAANASPTRVGSLLFLLVTMVLLSTLCVLFAKRARYRSGFAKSLSSRLLAGAGATWFGLFAFVFGLQLASGSMVLPNWMGPVFLAVLLVALMLMGAALLRFVHELFISRQALEIVGTSIGRLGFREWQVWTGLFMIVLPAVLLDTVDETAMQSSTPVAVAASILVIVGVLSVPWAFVIGGLGVIFGIRIVNARDKRRAEEVRAGSLYRLVSKEEMAHFAMVAWPLGSYVFGRESFFVPASDPDGVVVLGVPPDVADAGLTMPLARWGRSYLEHHGAEPFLTTADADERRCQGPAARPLVARLLAAFGRVVRGVWKVLWDRVWP